jgi:hypothetical protein
MLIEEMKPAELFPATQAVNIKAVRGLTTHHHRAPDQLNEEEVCSYLLAMRERGVACRTFKNKPLRHPVPFPNRLKRDWALVLKKGSPG